MLVKRGTVTVCCAQDFAFGYVPKNIRAELFYLENHVSRYLTSQNIFSITHLNLELNPSLHPRNTLGSGNTPLSIFPLFSSPVEKWRISLKRSR
jgi:hypothetical protein